jgi:dTDP-4-amino-4,6-dideoxygalactose transaminase
MDKPAIAGGKPVRDKSEFIVFGAPMIGKEEIDEVIETLRSGWIGTGPRVQRFENEFKKIIGAKHAIATNSCTAALHLSLITNGIKEGDEVIVTPMTFGATVNVIEHVRAKPIFADIEIDSFNIDPKEIRKKISPKTKAIIPVHLFGLPCKMDEINEIAKENNLKVIEDAAHALGSEFKGKKIGSLGNCTCFSFYPTKNITTIEGGMITTDDGDIANKARILGHHGQSLGAWQRYSSKYGGETYEVVYPGFKYNMPDVSAALGLHQLKKLERFLKIRERYAKIYEEELKDLKELILPPKGSHDFKHSWHLCAVLIRPEFLKIGRDEMIKALLKENIGTGIHYRAVHLHPYYREKYGFKKGDYPNAEFVSERTFSLPLSPKMSEKDVYDVVVAVKRIVKYFRK